MKAIHNIDLSNNSFASVGNYKLKYNFESNSQRKLVADAKYHRWEL
nr:hypothetical protein [Flavobacterium franklandianum]